jgi:hypothetical protein
MQVRAFFRHKRDQRDAGVSRRRQQLLGGEWDLAIAEAEKGYKTHDEQERGRDPHASR